MLGFAGKRRLAELEQRMADLEGRLTGVGEELQLLNVRLAAEALRADESIDVIHRLEKSLEAQEQSLVFGQVEQGQSMQALRQEIASLESQGADIRKSLAGIEKQADADLWEIRRMHESLLFLLNPKFQSDAAVSHDGKQ